MSVSTPHKTAIHVSTEANKKSHTLNEKQRISLWAVSTFANDSRSRGKAGPNFKTTPRRKRFLFFFFYQQFQLQNFSYDR